MTYKSKAIYLVVIDILILYLSLYITVFIYRGLTQDLPFFKLHLLPFTSLFFFWILSFFIEGLYSLRTFKQQGLVLSIFRSMLFNTLGAFIFFYLFPFSGLTPRKNIIFLALITSTLIFLWRKVFLKLFSYRGLKIKTMAIGDIAAIKEIENVLKDRPYLGFNIVKTDTSIKSLIPDDIELLAVDRNSLANKEALREILRFLDRDFSIIDLSELSEVVTGRIPMEVLDNGWVIQNCGKQFTRSYSILKSILDRGLALIIFVFIVPVYLILIPLLLIVSGRPIFYSQVRTGFKNRPFRIYKLRTMSVDAEKNGAKWATPKDSRVTPIGKFLRMTRLDEIPQLWNILNGDMSIVGPRPERPEIIEQKLSPNIPFYNFRHLVKPGVTGWAQVNYRYGYSENDSLIKLTYDLYYIKNKSLWLDIKIVLKTIKTVLTGMGH